MRLERISHKIGSLVTISILMHFASAHATGQEFQNRQPLITVFEYYQVDELPRYESSLLTFDAEIIKLLKWPDIWHGEGYVVLSFVVSLEGFVEQIKIEKGLCGQCDLNAVEALAQLEDWRPGVKNGKPVLTRMYVRINYTIK